VTFGFGWERKTNLSVDMVLRKIAHRGQKGSVCDERVVMRV